MELLIGASQLEFFNFLEGIENIQSLALGSITNQ